MRPDEDLAVLDYNAADGTFGKLNGFLCLKNGLQHKALVNVRGLKIRK